MFSVTSPRYDFDFVLIQELIKQYQPSWWSARALSPEEIIARHVSAVQQGKY